MIDSISIIRVNIGNQWSDLCDYADINLSNLW